MHHHNSNGGKGITVYFTETISKLGVLEITF